MSTTTEAAAEMLESRHRKEIKALEGEKRAALKKAKSTKGKKKAKEVVVSIEAEYDVKLKELQERHQTELSDMIGSNNNNTTSAGDDVDAPSTEQGAAAAAETVHNNPDDEIERQKKIEKARKKRERARQRELEKQRAMEREMASAGPSPRDVELKLMNQTVLQPRGLCIEQVAADGHCLYRAIGAEIGQDYMAVRALTADTLRHHHDEFAPFCEYNNNNNDNNNDNDDVQQQQEQGDGDDDDVLFASYVDTVRNTAQWGGHVELRALATALQRPIHVYSVADVNNEQQPLIIESISSNNNSNVAENDNSSNKTPIRLSYHLQYYALGEHYNRVIPSPSQQVDDDDDAGDDDE